jgi:hypothetical protein
MDGLDLLIAFSGGTLAFARSLKPGTKSYELFAFAYLRDTPKDFLTCTRLLASGHLRIAIIQIASQVPRCS